MSLFGLENLSNDLQSKVAGPLGANSENLPSAIYTSVAGWLSNKIYPLIIGVAVLATLLFTFYGAFLYFTAYGDENRATQAKKSITYAIIGFIIALLAFSIAAYVQNVILTPSGSATSTPLPVPVTNGAPGI